MNKNQLIKIRHGLFLPIAIILVLISCSKRKNILKSNGFIIFNSYDEWTFIPVKTIDTINCKTAFQTENLGVGIDFKPEFPYMTLIGEVADTLSVKIIVDGYTSFYTEKIVPVYMEYELDEEKINSDIKTGIDSCKLNIKNNSVKFSYHKLPIHIYTVTPLYCFSKKKSDIKFCTCEHREDDPNDYLYKICIHEKKQDKYTSYPCRLNIRKITSDTLKQQKVIKVLLTCCYTGDVAYFDPVSKELIKMYYGAK